MKILHNFTNETKLFYDKIKDKSENIFHPTLRLGVTGLSESGKTIFITAILHNLLKKQNLFFFEAFQQGRIEKILIEQQPDLLLPRFDFEKHSLSLERRIWPKSTRNLSQIRITFYYNKSSFFKKKLSIDIMDYPGEWLIDLPLLKQSFEEFSNSSFSKAQKTPYHQHALKWFETLEYFEKKNDFSEKTLIDLTNSYKTYLKNVRCDPQLSLTLSPGRFLVAGEFDESPAFTFFPLESKYQNLFNFYGPLLKKRFSFYKKNFIFPFFRQHVARVDRQVILLDFMQIFNKGPDYVTELEKQFFQILSAFHIDKYSWTKRFFHQNIDRILIASTKADHLHHSQHDQLEKLTESFVQKILFKFKKENIQAQKEYLKTLAISSIRATREANLKENDETLNMIIGTPQKNETLDGRVFDGVSEVAIYPGSLAKNINEALKNASIGQLHFINFRPPILQNEIWPHIRLDRALNFLLKDKLK